MGILRMGERQRPFQVRIHGFRSSFCSVGEQQLPYKVGRLSSFFFLPPIGGSYFLSPLVISVAPASFCSGSAELLIANGAQEQACRCIVNLFVQISELARLFSFSVSYFADLSIFS